jgi:hypothetical protein
MTWEDIRQQKEDSIRESTGNPMSKPFEIDGKSYNSYTEYSNSDEYNELLKIEEKVKEQYTLKAKEYFDSLETDNQLMMFFYITNLIFKNYFEDRGSYRGLLYDKFGFGPEAYSLGLDSGMFAVHNSISTPNEEEERFNALVKFLKLELSKEDLMSARNYFLYGFDNSTHVRDVVSGQKKFDFDKE